MTTLRVVSGLSPELEEAGIPFENEKSFPVRYRGRLTGLQRVDLIVDEKVIVEVKSVQELHPVHVAQVIGCLRLSRARVGLLVNFNVRILKQGLRRIVL